MNNYSELINKLTQLTWYDYTMLGLTIVIGAMGIILALKANKITDDFNSSQERRLKVSPQLEELFYSKLEVIPNIEKASENKKYLMDLINHVESVYDTERFESFKTKFAEHCTFICDCIANNDFEPYKKTLKINEECEKLRKLLRSEFFE